MAEVERALTREEHHARAMLMGRLYDWRDDTYCLPGNEGTPSGVGMIDANTLEFISGDEASTRRYARGTERKGWRGE